MDKKNINKQKKKKWGTHRRGGGGDDVQRIAVEMHSELSAANTT